MGHFQLYFLRKFYNKKITFQQARKIAVARSCYLSCFDATDYHWPLFNKILARELWIYMYDDDVWVPVTSLWRHQCIWLTSSPLVCEWSTWLAGGVHPRNEQIRYVCQPAPLSPLSSPPSYLANWSTCVIITSKHFFHVACHAEKESSPTPPLHDVLEMLWTNIGWSVRRIPLLSDKIRSWDERQDNWRAAID